MYQVGYAGSLARYTKKEAEAFFPLTKTRHTQFRNISSSGSFGTRLATGIALPKPSRL